MNDLSRLCVPLMKVTFHLFSVLWCSLSSVAIAQSPYCNEQTPQRIIPLILSYNSSDCTFSLSACTYETNSSSHCSSSQNPCAFAGLPCGGTACFRWRLYLNDVLDQSVCTGSSSHSFTGLEDIGEYKIMVEYKRNIQCSGTGICVIHIDQGTMTVGSHLSCTAINSAHSSSLPFSAYSSSVMTVNCNVQNNKRTILKSEEKVVGLPGFRSGTGSETYFHVSIEGCSFKTYSTSGDSTSANQDSIGSEAMISHVLRSINEQALQSERKWDAEDIYHSGISRSAALYPNPTTGLFMLQHPHTMTKVQVLDTFGRRVAVFAPNASTITIDLGDKTQGLYFIRATLLNGDIETYRVVLQAP